MKRLSYLFIVCLSLVFLLTSCDKLDDLDSYKKIDVGGTATMPFNGEYWVTFDAYNSTTKTWERDPGKLGYVRIMFYNLASNIADSVWFDDLHALDPFGLDAMKAKVKCDVKSKKFAETTNAAFKVFDGAVILKGALTPGKNVSDSIYITFELAADPGVTYRYAGYRRTGFLEDDH